MLHAGLALAAVVALSAHPAASAVPGFSAEQVRNAEAVVASAESLHLGHDAALLGLTAALGESGLRDLPYGDDAVNPDGTIADSVGLFQQQHWWGTLSERMDPAVASTRFFQHLAAVPGWATMTPTAAIHAVQRNADPDFYTRFVPSAEGLLAGLAGAPAAELAPPAPGSAPAAAPAGTPTGAPRASGPAAPPVDPTGGVSGAIDAQLGQALGAVGTIGG